jgi:hypothetical protein
VWDAATFAGATDGTAGRVGAALLAVTAAVAASVAFWYGAGAAVSVTVLIGVGVAAALALVSGSVLAAAVPAALILPRVNVSDRTTRVGGGNRQPEAVAASASASS